MDIRTTAKRREHKAEQDEVAYVRFTMACEGMPLTKRETARLANCASGKLNTDSEIQKLVFKYKRAEV
ncbi:MAG: hypothetical protein LBH17_00440 [Oscillospiraceae bacterium]|nr:hypothetical protein [Oscillospiraceae bacterium]